MATTISKKQLITDLTHQLAIDLMEYLNLKYDLDLFCSLDEYKGYAEEKLGEGAIKAEDVNAIQAICRLFKNTI